MGRGKLLKKALKDILAISKVTMSCFTPGSDKCMTEIGKNGKFMREYFKWRLKGDTAMMSDWIDKWDKAILANNNARQKLKIKNVKDLRNLVSYKAIKKARNRWYKEMEKDVKSGMILRSGKEKKLYGSVYLEEEIQVRLKF